jgi:catechol 2,3-dioxygenase-like lactoylglutathione lyase family enzyme
MTDAINILVQRFQNGQLGRREVVTALAALFAAATESAAAQSSGLPAAARTLNHVSISVADIKRSVEFYQSLFGMRIISQQGTGNNPIAGGDGSVVNLAPGAGPEFLGIYQGKPVGDIGHFCLGVQNFDADRVLAALQNRGVKASIRTRGQSREIFLSDPDNISVQLTDATYCGGSGPLGNQCK